jgi:hypothetical protein
MRSGSSSRCAGSRYRILDRRREGRSRRLLLFGSQRQFLVGEATGQRTLVMDNRWETDVRVSLSRKRRSLVKMMMILLI